MTNKFNSPETKHKRAKVKSKSNKKSKTTHIQNQESKANGLALFEMKSIQDAEQIKREQEEFKKTNVRSVMKLKQLKEQMTIQSIQV